MLEIADIFEKADIVCLTESWIKNADARMLPHVNEFVLARVVDPSRRHVKGRGSGGMLLFVRERIVNLCIFPSPPHLKQNVVWAHIRKDLFEYMFCFCYNPPTSSGFHVANFYDELSLSVGWLEERNLNDGVLLLLGDFNSRTGELLEYEPVPSSTFNPSFLLESQYEVEKRITLDKIADSMGRQLLQFCANLDMHILNGRYGEKGEFTFVARTGKSIVDYAIGPVYGVNDYLINLSLMNRIESDHLPLKLAVFFDTNDKIENNNEMLQNEEDSILVLPESAKWKPLEQSFIIEKMSKYLIFFSALIVLLVQNCNLLNYVIETFSKVLMLVACSLGLKKNAVNHACMDPLIALKKSVVTSLRKFRKRRTDYFLQIYLQEKEKYKTAVLTRENEKKSKEEAELQALYSIKNMGVLWRKIKMFTGSKVMISSKIQPKAWINHFNSVFNVSGRTNHEWNIKLEEIETQELAGLDGEITKEEMIRSLKKAKDGKSCGFDGIPVEIFKYGPDWMITNLLMLFNAILKLGTFPALWCKSIICPIFKKKGSIDNVNMYRGVALLCHTGKILTRILCKRLNKFTQERNILREEQAGFRSGYSTVDNCFILDSLVNKYVRNKRKAKLYCAFLDYAKAFDCVPRAALYYKLVRYGISAKFLRVLISMYRQASFAVRLAVNKSSKFIPSTSGVLQGCQMSPLLFSLYINDMCEYLEGDDVHPPTIGDTPISSLLFADDVVLISTTKVGLQRLINKSHKYASKWGMKISFEKSKIMVFRSGGRLQNSDKWYLENRKMEVVESFKYLGLTFSSSGKWSKHIKSSKSAAKGALARLKKLTGRISGIPVRLGLYLFDSLVSPVLLYGSEVTGFYQGEALNATASQFYRHILRCPPGTATAGLYLILDALDIQGKALERSIGYWLRILKMSNDRLPKKAYQHQCQLADQGKDCWVKRLRDLLDRLGFRYVWQNGGPVNQKRFKMQLKERLMDTDFSNKRMEALNKSSLTELCKIKNSRGPEETVFVNDIERRRAMALVLFNSPLRLVNRPSKDTKLCACCDELLKINIFSHLLSNCRRLEGFRYKEKLNFRDSSYNNIIKLLFRNNSQQCGKMLRDKVSKIISEANRLLDKDISLI